MGALDGIKVAFVTGKRTTLDSHAQFMANAFADTGASYDGIITDTLSPENAPDVVIVPTSLEAGAVSGAQALSDLIRQKVGNSTQGIIIMAGTSNEGGVTATEVDRVLRVPSIARLAEAVGRLVGR